MNLIDLIGFVGISALIFSVLYDKYFYSYRELDLICWLLRLIGIMLVILYSWAVVVPPLLVLFCLYGILTAVQMRAAWIRRGRRWRG